MEGGRHANLSHAGRSGLLSSHLGVCLPMSPNKSESHGNCSLETDCRGKPKSLECTHCVLVDNEEMEESTVVAIGLITRQSKGIHIQVCQRGGDEPRRFEGSLHAHGGL